MPYLPRFGLLLVVAVSGAPIDVAAYDRVASIGESPVVAETGPQGSHGALIRLIAALDRVTASSTKVVVQPFARSLKETAAGRADFHLPLIQVDDTPAPDGLAYVEEIDFGRVQFVIYSRKEAPIHADMLSSARTIEVQTGHKALFRFPTTETNCVPCTLDKILAGRTDALLAAADIVDPLLLGDARFRAIHRARYKAFLVRALVPANVDSTATRRYLIDGVTQIRKTGELSTITRPDQPYSDWQP